MVGTSSCHLFPLLVPALLLLLLVLLSSSPFTSNQFPQVLSSFSPFRQDETDPTPQPHVSLDGVLSTFMYKSSAHKAAIIKKKSNPERIEEDLARARASILKAVRFRNSTSETEDIFVPKGSIYRNAYAFYQLSTKSVNVIRIRISMLFELGRKSRDRLTVSFLFLMIRSHAEMVKSFKVWTYREGEPPLFHNGPLNNIYAIEGQFIDEMDSIESPCRARRPDEAHVFFLPLSVTGVVHYVYKPITSVKDYSRDRLQRLVTDYISTVATKYPYWNRSKGADHFMVSFCNVKSTSECCLFDCFLCWILQAPEVSNANPELFKHFIRVLCNANTSEGFRPKIDVSLPEIYLPFGKLGPPDLSRSPDHRPILAFFAGSPHGYIRKILMDYWKDKDSEVQVYARLPMNLNYTKMMGQSKFCLCPSGFEVASPREVEAIYAGCVPVVISDNYTLPFSDVLNWSQFSVQIPVGRIPEIKTILQGIPESKYLKMYKRVKRVRRHFELNRPAKPFDVIHMVLHSVWLRRLNFRLSP
ncbi:hypothetical protein GQ457_18G003710 [Hibiscus cannabinus]